MSVFLAKSPAGKTVSAVVTFVLVGASAVLLVLRAGGCRQRERDLATPFEAVQLDKSPAKAFKPVEDWPRVRGPRGDGISRENAGAAWPEAGLKRLWAWKVGIGYSSPVAANGRVYLFSLKDGNDVLACFDARTGDMVWSDGAGSGHNDSDYAGARATPTIDGDAIYTFGGDGEVVRRSLADGKPVWRTNVLAQTNTKAAQWGTASSPLVARGKVYVQAGQGGTIAVALDADTGKVAWASEATGNGSYASIILADVDGTPHLVVFAADAVYGMNPDTGRTIWRHPWNTSYGVNATTPVYRDKHLFITSAYGMGGMMLRLSPTGVEPAWPKPKPDINSQFQGVILEGNLLYGLASNTGVIVGLEWPSGKRRWRSNDSALNLKLGGSIVRAAGDKVVTMSQDGMLSLSKMTTDGPELLAQFEPFKDSGDDERRVWSTPLLYGGRVFVKGTRTFACYELPE